MSTMPAVAHVTVDDVFDGQRLDNFLIRRLKGVPKTHVYRVIRSGEVRVNGGRADAETRLATGDRVRIPPVRAARHDTAVTTVPPRDFDVIHEDDWLLAVDKPPGVAVHGGSGVSFGLIEQLRRARPQARFLELVHRLDKETSGVVLVAKKRSALTALQEQFRQRKTHKIYAALVAGRWPADRRIIDLPLVRGLDAQGERHVRVDADDESARRSITRVRIERPLREHTLLDVAIETGRTHQIRVHLAHEGFAIVGDPKYGDFAANRALARGPLRFARMFLHARRIAFEHPGDGRRVVLESPLPADCRVFVERLAAMPGDDPASPHERPPAATLPGADTAAASPPGLPRPRPKAPKARP
jgi:23S rRNA pseudouridine955/2504/2580 synthase